MLEEFISTNKFEVEAPGSNLHHQGPMMSSTFPYSAPTLGDVHPMHHCRGSFIYSELKQDHNLAGPFVVTLKKKIHV